MRHVFFIVIAVIILAGAQPGSCDWDELFQVNTDNTNKQAPRGVVDCPWSIAADDSGNVYAIWEDKYSRSGSESVEDGVETRNPFM